MDGIITLGISAGVIGLLVGAVAGYFRLSALRSFIVVYASVLLIVFGVVFAQGPFILALLGTAALAVTSMVPAAAGFVLGARFVRLQTASKESESAP
ncbi:MAG: hypothetical protein HYX45_04520 [Burkholderiales bacterium]|nr:hypothetical protein [Burkholderiales bacterium]